VISRALWQSIARTSPTGRILTFHLPQDIQSSGLPVGGVRRTLAGGEKLDIRLPSLDVLGGHPDPDVRRTVAKHDALAFFKVPQQTNNSAIREDEVLKVQRNGLVDWDCVEQLAQLRNILGIESAAHRQHDGATVSLLLNLEHRQRSGRNCRSNRQRLNIGSVGDIHAVEISPVARTWPPLGS
jgi:hypothetical protein